MKNKNIYYQSWVTIIKSHLRIHGENNGWRFTMLLSISSVYGIGTFLIIYVIKLIFKLDSLTTPDINIFPLPVLNGAFSFFIVFVYPYYLLNYFLIFYHDRYKKLIKIYEPLKERTYIIVHIGIFVGVGIISFTLNHFFHK